MIDIISNFALSVGASTFYDLAKAVIKSSQSKKLLFQIRIVIVSTLRAVVPEKYKNDDMFETIADKMILQIENDVELFKQDIITEIISNSLNDYGQSNVSPKLISQLFLAALPREIIKKQELNQLVNLNLQILSLNFIEDIKSETTIFGKKFYDLQTKIEGIDNNQRIVIDLLDTIRQTVNSEVEREDNTRFIPKNYIEFFEKDLFLEMYSDDSKAAKLADVYVEPKYIVSDFSYQNEKITYSNIIELIVDFTNNNLKSKNYNTKYSYDTRHINTLYIKGQPGSGKSSLFYYLAYNKCNNINFLPNTRMYFVKLIELLKVNNNMLNDLDPLADILRHVGMKNSELHNVLFVLDGLDEICTAKGLNIHSYCNNLTSSLTRSNNCKVIITTRINYINIPHSDNKNVFNVQLLSFDEDDLFSWVDKFFLIHNAKIELKKIAINNIRYASKHQMENYFEILSIPLLFYMIVTTGIEIHNKDSIGSLYDAVFEELIKRRYNEEVDNSSQKHIIYSEISPITARRIANEIAAKMYLEDKLLLPLNSKEIYSSISAVLNDINGKEELLNSYNKKRIERLFLITFFYKEANDVVEFAHKSIMEFFAAEKLSEILLNRNLDLKEKLTKVFAEKFITVEVYKFIKYRLNSWSESKNYDEELNFFKDELYLSFIKFLENGDLFQIISPNLCMFETGKLMFKAYWGMLKEMFPDTEKLTEIYNSEIFKYTLRTILNISSYEGIPFNDNKAQPFNFDNCVLNSIILTRCDLSYSLFTSSKLSEVNLSYSDLSYASFLYSKFDNISFYHANLENANLSNVDFGNADLRYATLYRSNLTNANFSNANLVNVLINNTEKAIEIKECSINVRQLDIFAEQNVNLTNPLILYEISIDEQSELDRKDKDWRANKGLIITFAQEKIISIITDLKNKNNYWEIKSAKAYIKIKSRKKAMDVGVFRVQE